MADLARAALIAPLPLLLAAAQRDGDAGLRLRAADGGALELRNDGPSPVAIDARLGIERREHGRWKNTLTTIQAIATCFNAEGNLRLPDSIGATVTFQPRQRLPVVRWMGYSCRRQCPVGCGFNIYLGPGPFRYVATVLPGGGKVRSQAFTMPRRPMN